MRDTPVSLPPLLSTDSATARQIIELHAWAVREGLRGTGVAELFEGLCRRLVVAGVPLWRGFAGMRTLHPQWAGYTYTWWRDRTAIESAQLERGDGYEEDLRTSPFGHLVETLLNPSGDGNQRARLRRRLTGPDARLDFPSLHALAAAGGTDYVAELVGFGLRGDPSRGTGIGYSLATDRPGGFSDDHLALIEAVVPAVSLAVMSDAEHKIAAGLLGAYLGADAGKRVHAGAVERGSVESIRAVLWYADIRGSTAIADATPGLVVVEMLDEVFESLTAALRRRGGQVLKFLGDGMLAIFPFTELDRGETCRRALDAAAAAMHGLHRLNAARERAGKPVAPVDLALHLGEVLYGNVGAADRLDFTVIGPAVNEAARIEALCEPLGRSVLVSAAFAKGARADSRLEPVGAHALRGVREASEIYALRL